MSHTSTNLSSFHFTQINPLLLCTFLKPTTCLGSFPGLSCLRSLAVELHTLAIVEDDADDWVFKPGDFHFYISYIVYLT